MTTKKLNTLKFIERAKEIHNSFYDYSKSIYINSRTNIIVTCPTHGDFSIRPDTHLLKKPRGCSKCGNNMISKDDFIKLGNKIHNNKYDYSKSEYKKKRSKITIICPKHGEFEQTPAKHLNGQGCPFCNRSEICGSKKMTTEQFIKQAKKIHGDRYDYSNTEYLGSRNKLEIICPKHGVFMVVGYSHLSGCGCAKCGFNTSLAGDRWIKSFNNPNIQTEVTLWINNKRYKVDGIDYTTNTIYEYFGSFWHGNPDRKDIQGLHPRLKIPFSELYEETLNRVKHMEENGYKVIYKWGR